MIPEMRTSIGYVSMSWPRRLPTHRGRANSEASALLRPLKEVRHLAVLVVFALVALPSGPIAAVDAPELENGKETYEEYCAACHGFDGIKQMPKVPNFAMGERLELPDKELLKTIEKGKGEEMPPWNEDLNEQEMKNVLAYIRTLKKTQ